MVIRLNLLSWSLTTYTVTRLRLNNYIGIDPLRIREQSTRVQ